MVIVMLPNWTPDPFEVLRPGRGGPDNANKSFVTERDHCPPNLNNVEVTVQNKLHYCRKFSSQNSSMKINKEQ